MTPSKKISISQGNTSRDYSHIWDLDNGNFLAFLADAPSHAEQRSGMYVKKFINENVESFKNTIYHRESDEIALMMADFITAISDDLLKIGKGNAYATMILTLVFKEYLYALTVGDAVLYVIGKSVVRISEITRLNGRSFLAGSIPREPIRYKEYSYMGNEPKCFTQKDVWRLPTDGMKLIALASDGAETQFGSRDFVNLLTQGVTLEEKEEAINRKLSGQPIKDDVTVLMAEVNLKHPANIVKRFQKEITEIRENQETIETNLDSNNKEIKTTLDSHKNEIKNTIELLSSHVAQKANKKEFEETIANFNKSFETLIKGMDRLIDQRIRKNLEEDSGEVTIEGLLNKINNMIDAKTTGVKNDLDEIKRKMDSLLRQFVEDPQKTNRRLTLNHFINELIDRKIIKFVSVDDIEPLIEREVSRYIREKQVKVPTETGQSPEPGVLETSIDFPPEDEVSNIEFRKKGIWARMKQSLNRFFKTNFTKHNFFVFVTSFLFFCIAASVLYLTLFKKPGSPSTLQQQTAPPRKSSALKQVTQPNAKAGPQTDLNQEDKKNEKKETMMVPWQCQIYIAYLSPRIILDKGIRRESQTLVCENYEAIIEKISAGVNNTLLLPLKEAIINWDELQKIKVNTYPNTTYTSFSWKYIPWIFVIKTNVFKSLQKEKNLEEKFVFRKGEPFNYISFYYKVNFDEQLEAEKLMKLLKVFNLSGAELETFNPGINIKDLKGKIINLPLTEKPPDLQGI